MFVQALLAFIALPGVVTIAFRSPGYVQVFTQGLFNHGFVALLFSFHLRGVLGDELVSTSQGVSVRRVRYYCAQRGEVFSFLTNECTLPPGVIAHLYRLRWEIEKTFDELKNKLGETKAWAGVTIELLDGDGNVVATDVTDANGYYEFENLLPGE